MIHTLNVAQTGLKVSQTQVENVMNNIANENVEGYKKRVVDISELGHADARITGRGAYVDGVSRATQIYMYQNLITEQSKLSNVQTLNSTLADIESLFKETDTSGLSVELNNYFKSIENLRTTPHSEVYKNDIIQTANSVVKELQQLYSAVDKKETLMLNETQDTVDKVNSILKEIGSLSEKIANTTSQTHNDLLDKRDALEKELAQFIDVEIFRGDTYELKVGGATAVRFDTNVHQVKLVEKYTPQVDVYAQIDSNGHTITTGINGDYKSSIITDPANTNKDLAGNTLLDGTPSPSIAEVQTLDINGTVDATGEVEFLGTKVAVAAGSDGAAVAAAINADRANIVATWNASNPDREIEDNPAGSGSGITVVGNQITITYKTTEGDVPAIDNSASGGIAFTGSLETTKGIADSITYVLNGTNSLTVTVGEIITDNSGNPVDFDSSGAPIGEVTKDNMIQALVHKINEDNDIGSVITAYNGKYETSKNGVKVLTDNVAHSKYQDPATAAPANPNNPGFADRYLYIEGNIDGEDGKFVGELIINNGITGADPKNERTYLERNEYVSKDAIDDIHLEIYDKEIEVAGGALKPLIDNLKTDSGNNTINTYKDMLDQFARKLVDLTESYIENSDTSYIYGETNVNKSYDADKAVQINLFEGASVETLRFNERSLNSMSQEKLDYLAELQWKKDIDFDGTGENNQSFSEYFQTLRVKVSDDREGVRFKEEAQEAVKEALQSSYDNVVKVDKDAELLELIKFQKAYEANAKIVTVVDEMLETLLGIKR